MQVGDVYRWDGGFVRVRRTGLLYAMVSPCRKDGTPRTRNGRPVTKRRYRVLTRLLVDRA